MWNECIKCIYIFVIYISIHKSLTISKINKSLFEIINNIKYIPSKFYLELLCFSLYK